MGNISSQRLSLHRFLALTVSHSTTINPRHLEHYIYPYWTGDIGALIVPEDFQYSLIAPQFPVYVSPKVRPGPDESGTTEADGEAEGVYVDIAVVMPILESRPVEDLGEIGKQLVGKSLAYFFHTFRPHETGLSPRCLWVSGYEAALLGELKRAPTRHARNLKSFLNNLKDLLRDAVIQAETQALCLFSSWRFGTQDVVILLAGAGEYYQIRRVTREWSQKELNGKPYTSELLMELKAAARFRLEDMEEDEMDSEEDELEEDDDLEEDDAGADSEGQEEKMYDLPSNAKERQDRIRAQYRRDLDKHAEKRAERAERDQERDQRAERRTQRVETLTAQLDEAMKVQPSADRTAPLFTDAAPECFHRLEEPNLGAFFESEEPEKYFAGSSASDESDWSRILQLGSEISYAPSRSGKRHETSRQMSAMVVQNERTWESSSVPGNVARKPPKISMDIMEPMEAKSVWTSTAETGISQASKTSVRTVASTSAIGGGRATRSSLNALAGFQLTE
ncbi:hypothetical protein DFH07DRAFT_767633 [Mycena maculata]|uniref:Uncharacterized protein n=1 Tax=Mycena maculata TaxID=230809 RepID=A0AAD7JXC5_9AGAR|nr:hypothetical protein DFH07DRAFT_767633 [Mycena maculata]